MPTFPDKEAMLEAFAALRQRVPASAITTHALIDALEEKALAAINEAFDAGVAVNA